MLDPEQVQKTVAGLQEASARRSHVDPALPLALMTQRLQAERVFAELPDARGTLALGVGRGDGLVETGLAALLGWLSGEP